MAGQSSVMIELTECVAQHYARLYQYAYRLTGSAADAEDIVQQSFLTAQQNWQQLKDREKAAAWLFTIARNHFLKMTARDKKWHSLEEALEPVLENTTIDRIDEEVLQLALNELPDNYRQIVILYYFDDFSYKEISEQLSIPLGTIMSRLSRGKAILRQKLTTRVLS